MRHASRRRQHGAVIITVFLVMLFLLGFMGIALDFGRLFVVKSELQTAVDSCALAAAQELDLQSTALERATSAGLTAGNLNSVNFQSNTWSGQGQLVAADITFKDAAYLTTTVAALAQYAQCQHVQPAVRTWLLQALGAFTGDTTTFPSTNNVMASAVATRAHGQSTCPIPVALKPKECPPGSGAPCPGPLYGFAPGDWITVLTSQSTIPGGYIGWANLDGTNSASETKAEMNGKCGTKVEDQLGTPGVQTTIAEDWNYRFGIYKKVPDFNVDPSYMRPDYTGYSYSAANWPSQSNAYGGSDPGAAAGVQNYATNSTSPNFAACAPDGSVTTCETISAVTLQTFKFLAAPGSGPGSHGTWGSNRRIVTVPVTDNTMKVVDFACMLMLQPLSIPMGNVQLEFIGNASNPTSPCSFSGMPGGAAGPLVPALVR